MTKKKINEKDVKKLLKNGLSKPEIAIKLGCQERHIYALIAKMKMTGELSEIEMVQAENVKLSKKVQKQQDMNRIKNKSFREHARIENAVTELNTEIKEIFKNHELPKKIFRTKSIKASKKVGGMFHLTDLHLNELVNIMSNRYDFNIASQRIRKYRS